MRKRQGLVTGRDLPHTDVFKISAHFIFTSFFSFVHLIYVRRRLNNRNSSLCNDHTVELTAL